MTPGKTYISKIFYPRLWRLTEERVAAATPEELATATAQYGNMKIHFKSSFFILPICMVGIALKDGLSSFFAIFLALLAIFVVSLRYMLVKRQPRYIVMSQYAWYFYTHDRTYQLKADKKIK